MRKKTLAEQANRFMDEDFLQSPQPATTFDPFAPNYGDTPKASKPVSDENKPMDTDAEKDVDQVEPETSDNEDEEKGNKSFVKKSFTEISELFKDVIAESKNIGDKLDNLVTGIDSASNEKIISMEGVSKQLTDDVEKFNTIIKSFIEILNSVDDASEEEKNEPEGKTPEVKDEEPDENEGEEPEADTGE